MSQVVLIRHDPENCENYQKLRKDMIQKGRDHKCFNRQISMKLPKEISCCLHPWELKGEKCI